MSFWLLKIAAERRKKIDNFYLLTYYRVILQLIYRRSIVNCSNNLSICSCFSNQTPGKSTSSTRKISLLEICVTITGWLMMHFAILCVKFQHVCTYFLNSKQLTIVCILDRYIFPRITTFIKVWVSFAFGLQILLSIDFPRIYQLKCLEPKKQRLDELLWMLWFYEKV